MSKITDAYLVYNLVKRLITPFDKWPAFTLGIIDAKGKVLKDRQSLTAKEQDSWGYFDIAVANLKKILAKVPGGSSRLASFAAAAFLFKEHKKYDIDQLDQLTEAYVKKINEDGEGGIPTNNAGSGQIAAVGVTPPGYPKNWGEPPKGKAKLKSFKDVLRRKAPNVDSKLPT